MKKLIAGLAAATIVLLTSAQADACFARGYGFHGPAVYGYGFRAPRAFYRPGYGFYGYDPRFRGFRPLIGGSAWDWGGWGWASQFSGDPCSFGW